MNIRYVILTMVLVLSGCANNSQLRTVVADIEATPKCDTTNVLTHPRDTKETLKGKVVILNSKLDCHDDSKFYTKEKLDRYKKL